MLLAEKSGEDTTTRACCTGRSKLPLPWTDAAHCNERQTNGRRYQPLEWKRPGGDQRFEQADLLRAVRRRSLDPGVVHPAKQSERIGVLQQIDIESRRAECSREGSFQIATVMSQLGVERPV